MKEDTVYCSFCNKSQHYGVKLLAGFQVWICELCVETADTQLREESKDYDERRPLAKKEGVSMNDYVIPANDRCALIIVYRDRITAKACVVRLPVVGWLVTDRPTRDGAGVVVRTYKAVPITTHSSAPPGENEIGRGVVFDGSPLVHEGDDRWDDVDTFAHALCTRADHNGWKPMRSVTIG